MWRQGWRVNRRRLSTTTTGADTTTTRSSLISRVRSRREWLLKHPKSKVEPKPKANVDDKPWPKSVVYGAAGAAAVFVPYTILWITLSFPALRKRFLTPDQIDLFRRHFGTAEPNLVPYTDVLNEDGVTDPQKIPYVLPGERSPSHEAIQAELEDQLSRSIPLQITVGDDALSNESKVFVTLPASELANAAGLLQHCQGSNTMSKGTFVAVDFPEIETEGEILPDLEPPAIPISGDELPPHFLDPLLRETSIYSTWYYQPPLQNLDRSTNHVTSQYTNDELQMRHLEREVARLELELRDLKSTRPFDDIQDELNACRSQLRRLKWKGWLPWVR